MKNRKIHKEKQPRPPLPKCLSARVYSLPVAMGLSKFNVIDDRSYAGHHGDDEINNVI